MRDRPIDLLAHKERCPENVKNCGECPCFDKEYFAHCNEDAATADMLLANGVILPEWISVKERLPELHTKVLCCGVKGGRFIAETSEWGEGHLYWTKRDGKGCPEVTHWMPLPKPPKAEKALRKKDE